MGDRIVNNTDIRGSKAVFSQNISRTNSLLRHIMPNQITGFRGNLKNPFDKMNERVRSRHHSLKKINHLLIVRSNDDLLVSSFPRRAETMVQRPKLNFEGGARIIAARPPQPPVTSRSDKGITVESNKTHWGVFPEQGGIKVVGLC